MSFLKRVANGLGTLLGVLVDRTAQVISHVKEGYEAYRRQGGSTGEKVVDEIRTGKDRLQEINDEIMHLRNIRMSTGRLDDGQRNRWEELRSEREQLLEKLNLGREVRAAEKIMETESVIQKVEIDLETSHVLQFNAFADAIGKKCRKCGRPMKLQWKQGLNVVTPYNFFWGCTGWYVMQGNLRACEVTERLVRDDYGLMTDTSAPEFALTAEEFGIILADGRTARDIDERVSDLRSDLSSRQRGVELVACPVHGQNMTLRRKSGGAGLLDTFFLACPHWKPNGEGCTFMEKLKSGAQLAALLRSETGRGIL